MGETTRANGIRDFWPDDTETSLYLESSTTLADLTEKINDTWPGASADNIRISSKFIHTSCLGYDLMAWGDYTHFIHIERLPGA